MVAVGISGATGCIYGIRLLEALRALGQETELILSDWGAETIRLETDLTVEQVKALADRVYDNRNMAAQAASGSSCADAMVIAPCSMKTLAGIAMGYDDSLLVRAADVMLKERRRLILLTRETPLNLSHIRNMETVTLMGGIILILIGSKILLEHLGIGLLQPAADGGRHRGSDSQPDAAAAGSGRRGKVQVERKWLSVWWSEH